jgi:hypothetical protein
MDVGLRQGFSASRNKNESSSSSSSGKVRVNASDQLPNYLANKLSAGTYIALTASKGVLTVSTTGLSTVAGSGNYNDLSNKPTLGTAAALDVGTTANKIVQLDGSARLPAVDGSQLTNLPSSSGTGLTVVYSNSATVTAVANRIYLLDGTTTLNLPAGTNGAIIGVGDYASNFGSSNLTIDANGSETIAGEATLVLNTNNACVELVFHAGNWTITQAESFYDFSALLSDVLPEQSTHSGKFLTTNGTAASWSAITIDGLLPSQTGQNGKYLTTNGTTASWATVSGSKHTIEDEGTPLTSRTKLNFVGTGVAVTDDSGNDRTVVTISGSGGGGHTINDEGTPLTARASLDFVGAGVTATDDSGNNKTIVTIPGTPVNPLILPHISTPSAPSSGNTSLYAKSDNKLYFRPAGGAETEVGAGGGGGTTFADDVFRIQDNSDATKQIAFEASGITTGTTRTLTVPDNSGTLAVAGTLTDKALYYYDNTSKLFKPVAIGTTDQVLVAKPSLDPPYQFAAASGGGGRELLTGNRTYYVRTDGSDSNNGLADSSGGAFLTVQKGVDTICGLDCGTYQATLQLQASQTFTQNLILKPTVGSLAPIIQTSGSIATLTASSGSTVTIKSYARWGLKNVRLTQPSDVCIFVDVGGLLLFPNSAGVQFGSCAYAIQNQGFVFADENSLGSTITISASQSAFLRGVYNSYSDFTRCVFTLTGTPSFSIAFAFLGYGAVATFLSGSHSGSATGKYYDVQQSAMVRGYSAGNLPGNTGGTTATGGIYVT